MAKAPTKAVAMASQTHTAGAPNMAAHLAGLSMRARTTQAPTAAATLQLTAATAVAPMVTRLITEALRAMGPLAMTLIMAAPMAAATPTTAVRMAVVTRTMAAPTVAATLQLTAATAAAPMVTSLIMEALRAMGPLAMTLTMAAPTVAPMIMGIMGSITVITTVTLPLLGILEATPAPRVIPASHLIPQGLVHPPTHRTPRAPARTQHRRELHPRPFTMELRDRLALPPRPQTLVQPPMEQPLSTPTPPALPHPMCPDLCPMPPEPPVMCPDLCPMRQSPTPQEHLVTLQPQSALAGRTSQCLALLAGLSGPHLLALAHLLAAQSRTPSRPQGPASLMLLAPSLAPDRQAAAPPTAPRRQDQSQVPGLTHHLAVSLLEGLLQATELRAPPEQLRTPVASIPDPQEQPVIMVPRLAQAQLLHHPL